MSFFFKSCAKASKVAMSTVDAQDIESFLTNAEKVTAGSGQPSNGNSTSTTTHSSPPPPYPTSYANNTSKPEEPVYHIPPPPVVNKPVTQYHQPTYGYPSPAPLSSAMNPDPSSIANSTASLPPYTASIPALGNAPAASHTTHTAITPSSPTFSSGHTKLPSTDPVSAKPTRIYSMAAIPTRKKRCRALFIGINYPGTRAALRGCVNDVKMMMRLLKHLNFSLDDIRILVDTDEVPNCHAKPTKANIIEGMKWLVEGAQDGDTLFLHYSGHGTQVKDTSGDEEDGMDEALVPCDYQSSGLIIDDDIVQYVISPLPAGVRLTSLMDCCHSGTLMDLPYTWVASENNTRSLDFEPKMKFGSKWVKPNFLTKIFGSNTHNISAADVKERDFVPSGNQSPIPAEVVMFSGCRDEQTSADVGNTKRFNIPAEAGPGEAGGACTSALTEVLMKESNVAYVDLLEKMRVSLKRRRFTQIPQLSSSKPVDLNLNFSLFGSISSK